LRGPVMIAKAAASLAIMSGGRFDLGIGAGTFWNAVGGMGGPVRGSGESIDALGEAVRIIRAALDGERVVRGPGTHYPVPGYPAGPVPARRVELWLGVYRRRGLELIARHGDGWIPSMGYLGPDAFHAASARLDKAVLRAGRDPASIRRIYNLGGVITDGPLGDGPLEGPVELWVDTLKTRAIEQFAAEVAPAVREAVSSAERP
jgi:alkanesulfonate monooxygenase SsuD/methylene tetrahydromethanopterin reductase-like flavin-dependent oxidoreductase (luciferase family)